MIEAGSCHRKALQQAHPDTFYAYLAERIREAKEKRSVFVGNRIITAKGVMPISDLREQRSPQRNQAISLSFPQHVDKESSPQELSLL